MAVCNVIFSRGWKTTGERDISNDVGLLIGKAAYRSIIDTMELLPPENVSNEEWVEYLNLIYSWRYLYVEKTNERSVEKWDNGPSFIQALLKLKKTGPTGIVIEGEHLNQFYKDLDKLHELFDTHRNDIEYSN